ncbi:MAG: hypothetical protein AAB723_02585 [Patescibacteria group bacterium]
MKKSFLFIVLAIFIVSSGFANLAMGQTTTEADNSATSVASIVKIKSAGSFINDGKNLLKEAWQKVSGSKRGEVMTNIKAWFAQRKQAIKNGWQEEKQEFSGHLQETISQAWQKAINKIKSWIFRQKGD